MAMTKVQARFRLQKPLDASLAAQLRRVAGVYGILKLYFDELPEVLRLEYDASRLRLAEVERLLRRYGIPAMPEISD